VLQLACVTFIGILFLGALAIDGGNLLAARRQAQNCCDSAALAGCIKLATVQAQGGTPTAAQLFSAANDALSTNNYTNGTNCTVTDAVTVRSVASVTTSDSPSVPILLIDPTSNGEVFSIYSGEFTMNLIPMQINSTSPVSALIGGGRGATANVTLDLVGGYNGGSYNPTPIGGAVPIANPYALVQPPSNTGLITFSQSTYLPDGNNNITLNPGYYPNGININNGGNVTLNSGIYSIGSGVWINTPGTVTGNQVMLYVSGTDSLVQEKYNQSVAMWLSPTDGNYAFTAPTSGPYAGLSFFTA